MPDWFMRQLEKFSDWIGSFSWKGGNIGCNLFLGISLVVAAAFGIFLSVMFGGSFASSPKTATEETPLYIEVKPGMAAREIGQVLMERKVIGSQYYFWLLAKIEGVEGQFHIGTYKLYQDMEARKVLEMLVNGETAPLRFTIPEGFNVNEIAERLGEEGIASPMEIKAEAAKFAPYHYIKKVPAAMYQAEGFLFPDTYEIEPGMTAREILVMMARNFDERLTDEMRRKAEQMGLSIFELITLASLVEKEARFEEDRPKIAQVFLKRLQIGMPLQSCTTIQYLLHTPKEDVTYDDLEIESPYNTYHHMGLPPGPVANPGLASIEAVLNPANTDYLYFVADRKGRNYYSQTYSEHLDFVEQVR